MIILVVDDLADIYKYLNVGHVDQFDGIQFMNNRGYKGVTIL